MSFIRDEKRDTRNALSRLKNRDFSGDAGKAVRNSTFQFTTNILIKFSSLIFTLVLARILQPEKFGLYTLALSTIILFSAFTDFGISQTLLTFLSKEFRDKNYKKANGYIRELLKWKLLIMVIISLILVISGYFVANYFYNKPLYLSLVAGVFYIFFNGLLTFFEAIYRANNDFKTPLKKELIFQILRLLLVPAVAMILSSIFAHEDNFNFSIITAGVILTISVSYLISLVYLFSNLRKAYPKNEIEKLNSVEKKTLLRFVIPLSTLVFSGIFFGYIDTIMLGRYVPSEYLSYYGAAFALASSAVAIIGFTAASFYPIFAVSKGVKLEKFFRKARMFTFLISIAGGIATLLLARIAVILAYGREYLPATVILKLFSVLAILIPVSGIYDSYFLSQKKTKVIAITVFVTTVINVVLNLTGIKIGLSNPGFFLQESGAMGAIVGVSIATIISRFVYLLVLSIYKIYFLRKSL